MTPAEAKTSDIVSRTPSVCLPNDEDLVFIDDGKCIAQVVNEKTRKVLRTLRTTVVPDDISEIKVGNEIAVLSPLYFTAGTATMKASSVRRLNTMTTQVKAAGSILVAGHSGVLMGDTPENRALSRQRAATVVSALKKRGATADFAIAAVGALDPVSTGDSRADQDKNRRAVVVLIP
jgi:outer membrane protein OmpA-like peptidoglycan-associated protein